MRNLTVRELLVLFSLVVCFLCTVAVFADDVYKQASETYVPGNGEIIDAACCNRCHWGYYPPCYSGCPDYSCCDDGGCFISILQKGGETDLVRSK